MKNRAFTLIEVIAAIFVLLVGILGTSAATQQIISYISFSNSKLSAIYIAQEGVEIVKNIKDANWLEAEYWANGLGGGDWEADYNDTPPLDSYNDNHYLNLETTGFYGYGLGTPTKFKRKITIIPVGEDILEVTVLIQWRERGKTNKITVRENLYNADALVAMPGGCDGSTFNPICSGTDTVRKTWADSIGADEPADSTTDGESNTNNLVADPQRQNEAALYCYDMIYNGYDDWYLPAKDQLSILYEQRVAIGGFATSEPYWSSTQFAPDDPDYAWRDKFISVSWHQANHRKDMSDYVRCVRGQ